MTRILDRGNDVDAESLNAAMIDAINEPPLHAREGGIRIRFVLHGAKREGHPTFGRIKTTYEVAHAA